MKPGFKSALEKYTQQFIKQQDPHQSVSANFRLPKIGCQSLGASTDPKKSADLRSQADGSAVHTSTL